MFAEIGHPKVTAIVCYTKEECEVIFKKLCPTPRPLFSYWDSIKRVLYNNDKYFLLEFDCLIRYVKGTTLDKIYINNNLTDEDKKYTIETLYPTLREHSKDNVIYI
jgi:hypothetical protein